MNVSIPNIQILMDEHNNIKRMLKILKHHCLILLNNADCDLSFFPLFLDFAKNYADKHHHGKEELILFDFMVKELGVPAQKLVNAGMLVEHDLGRHYIKLIKTSLDAFIDSKQDEDRLNLITASMAYSELLIRHINKEDQVVYTFAIRALSKTSMDEIESQSIDFETIHSERKAHYEAMLERLENSI